MNPQISVQVVIRSELENDRTFSIVGTKESATFHDDLHEGENLCMKLNTKDIKRVVALMQKFLECTR